jgi:hypothetical protein
MDQVSQLTGNAQVISQLKANQLVKNRNGKWVKLTEYFARQAGVETNLTKRARKRS